MAHTDPHGGHGPGHGGPIRHETTDANLQGVEKLILFVVVFLAIVTGAMWLAFEYFYDREVAQDVKPPVVANRQGDRLPPLPRLQTTPYVDLAKFRQGEAASVSRYAWADKANGLVQVPVSRAMDLVAEQGLPTFAPVAAPGAGAEAPASMTPTAPAAGAPGAGAGAPGAGEGARGLQPGTVEGARGLQPGTVEGARGLQPPGNRQ
jgi:hypothetical protein